MTDIIDALNTVRAALMDRIEGAQTPLGGTEPPYIRKMVEEDRRVAAAIDVLEAVTRPEGEGIREALQKAVEYLRYERWVNDPGHRRRLGALGEIAAPLAKLGPSDVQLDSIRATGDRQPT